MKISVNLDYDDQRKLTIKFLKESLELGMRFGADRQEIKAYLYILSDHMYIGDFKKYAKKKDLEDYCEEIYKKYDYMDRGENEHIPPQFDSEWL